MSTLEVSSPVRARRATTKAVNYAKEQEFSDAEGDMFEDNNNNTNNASDEEAKPKRVRAPRASRAAREKQVTVLAPTTTNASGRYDPAFDDLLDHHSGVDRPVYTEKGYDSALPPIRERFPFLPEYEEDGSPKIELIVGRRAVDETNEEKAASDNDEDSDESDDDEQDNNDNGLTRTRRSTTSSADATPANDKKRKKQKSSPKKGSTPEQHQSNHIVEYEYLVKYKGRSYLHLEWKTGADLESMNKSAKGIYRRYLKKLAVPGTDTEELESPEFDASYVVPEKIVDEADQEIAIELTDKELLKWEQQRETEHGNDNDDDDDDDDKESSSSPRKPNASAGGTSLSVADKKTGAY